MRVTVETRDSRHIRQIEALRAELIRLLAEAGRSAEQPILLALADSLLVYSHSHDLLKLPAPTFLDLLCSLRDFLARRDLPVHTDWLTVDSFGSDMLLINSLDTPYLVDSLQVLFQKNQLPAVIISHPLLTLERVDGVLTSLAPGVQDRERESLVLVQVEQSLVDASVLSEQVRQTVAMVQEVGRQRPLFTELLDRLRQMADREKQVDFFDWLQAGNFLCFGYRAADVAQSDGGISWRSAAGPVGWFPAGLLDDGPGQVKGKVASAQRQRLLRDKPLLVELTYQISPIYRDEPLVYIGFREPQAAGRWREHALVGLFSQGSINELACSVPALRSRIMAALNRQKILPDSYDFRKVLDLFNTFPKVELFFLDDDEIDLLVRSLVSLQRHKSVKIVFTRSLSLRGLTLLMIMPREFYGSTTLRRLEAYLQRAFNARQIDSRVINFFADYLSLHVRVVPRGETVTVDTDRLEKMLTRLARPWPERLRSLLLSKFSAAKGLRLWKRYADSLSVEYQTMVHPRFALRDILAMEHVLADGKERFTLWGPFHGCNDFFTLQFYSLRASNLNELMPFLENLSLSVVEEVDHTIKVGRKPVFIKSFSIRNDQPEALPLAPQRANLLEILHGLRRGIIENDYLNRLMVVTGFDWKQIDLFRAYRNYYFQLGNPFTKRRVAFALINNPQVVILLYRYFEARFLPRQEWSDQLVREEEALMPVRLELAEALEAVSDINEDRILRSLFNLIDSTIRTNFFLRRNSENYFLAFKISAIGIIDMPFPRPMYETYVHSASMEGIHLRGGKIARGGIRWSDRPDDFRTEVLGLMKTQMTKNALIVPVGSKGGFVVKTPFSGREEGAELSRQAYITLMRGLLDLADNRVGGEIERPAGVVVHDDVDPYLVVAADKGTAHLPDTANAVSREYGFWLGDAFASGGSAGYDHKKLGITARGAWECVKRHFRELGKDIQSENFSVVGIGDMSGDVFGNGMLLSKHIRLLAAFNHLHIFLDPDPDPQSSWGERCRLFNLTRSTWADYDPSLISKGGGVWARSAKDIPLSPQVRRWLGVRHTSMEGDELIRRLLAAEVELLWNGGIGTYVKASSEKHSDVGDRGNDNVRVNASQVRAKVIGEGGNLGLTQRARVEYALAGGRLNTDSIDNSAGVDTSDHEVNLKIFFRTLHELKLVKTGRSRDSQLQRIEDEVCHKVLRNNYTQSLCLSLDELRCRQDSEPFFDLIDRLGNAGLLDRQGEFLPGRKEVAARGGTLTRPELAILLSYSKMHLYTSLLESDLPDREPLQSFLNDYVPQPIARRYGEHLHRHPLRREIIATMITNRIIDQAGCTFLNTLSRQTGASSVQGVAAYLVFDEVLGGAQIRACIEAGDNRLAAALQYQLLLDLENSLAGLCGQLIEQGLPLSVDRACVDRYRQQLELFVAELQGLLSAEEWQACQARISEMRDDGLDDSQAGLLASFRYLPAFLPAVQIAGDMGLGLSEVSQLLSELRNRLRFTELRACLDDYVAHDRWDRMALAGLQNSYLRQFVRLAEKVIASGGSIGDFFAERRRKVDTYLGLVDALKANPPASISPFMVLLRTMESLVD